MVLTREARSKKSQNTEDIRQNGDDYPVLPMFCVFLVGNSNDLSTSRSTSVQSRYITPRSKRCQHNDRWGPWIYYFEDSHFVDSTEQEKKWLLMRLVIIFTGSITLLSRCARVEPRTQYQKKGNVQNWGKNCSAWIILKHMILLYVQFMGSATPLVGKFQNVQGKIKKANVRIEIVSRMENMMQNNNLIKSDRWEDIFSPNCHEKEGRGWLAPKLANRSVLVRRLVAIWEEDP